MKRSKMSLSHYRLLTADMGKLIPLTWYEALPGDSIQQATNLLVRSSPLVAPMMHPVRIRIHHWFVPNRILWSDWEDFITGGPDGTFEAAPPQLPTDTEVAEGSLLDYLGFPTTTTPHFISALPVRAYINIFNEFYRDQDLVTELAMSTASGEDSTSLPALQTVSWEKDMYSTLRPWETKGNQITIPIGDTAPVKGIGHIGTTFPVAGQQVYETDGTTPTYDHSVLTSQATQLHVKGSADTGGIPDIYADLSQATGITVNELREYLALQRYQEARARHGSRFSEYLRYAFGVNPQDARLQEPEYLGGGRQQLQISEVLQSQRSDEGESPLGTMAGHGISAMRTNRFRRFIPEHGIVMTLMSVVPKAMYADAIERKWHRMNKEMYFQRELQFIGEQEVANREVYSEHSVPNGVFGYSQRYDEYRYAPSGVSGEFRSTLNHWHLAREFGADPALNADFINCNPAKRVFADSVSHSLWIMANHSIQARRAVAKWATPKTF